MAEIFHENVVILTGASSGIGRELALQLADQGAWLSLAARDAGRLERVAAECRERRPQARTLIVPTDVSQEAACRRLVERTLEEYGRLDTLINNAGITQWARFDEMQTLAPFEQVMQVNYFGSLYCTYYALPYLKRNQGRIVAVSSLAGKTGVPARSGYAASKHAVTGFFDTLRIELTGSGVSVTVTYPDFVKSETRTRALGPDGRPLGESPVREGEVMSAETCARMILQAAAGRQREQIQTLRGRLGQWLKLAAPGLVDRIAQRAIQRGR